MKLIQAAVLLQASGKQAHVQAQSISWCALWCLAAIVVTLVAGAARGWLLRILRPQHRWGDRIPTRCSSLVQHPLQGSSGAAALARQTLSLTRKKTHLLWAQANSRTSSSSFISSSYMAAATCGSNSSHCHQCCSSGSKMRCAIATALATMKHARAYAA